MHNNETYQAKIKSKDGREKQPLSVYLFSPWTYDNYQDPKAHRLANGTPLYIGNIGYCKPLWGYSAEIIVFFADATGRLMRTAEFHTDNPIADLEQLLCLQESDIKIEYFASEDSWNGRVYLKEDIRFFKEGEPTRCTHRIESESHALISFNNGNTLSESNLRKMKDLEATVPFFIDKLFPKKIASGFIPTHYIKNTLSDFISRHSLSLSDNPRSKWTFSAVQDNNVAKMHMSLVYKIQDGNFPKVAEYISENDNINPEFNLGYVQGRRDSTPINEAYISYKKSNTPERLKIILLLESIRVQKKLTNLITQHQSDLPVLEEDTSVYEVLLNSELENPVGQFSNLVSPGLMRCAYEAFLSPKQTPERQKKQLDLINELEKIKISKKCSQTVGSRFYPKKDSAYYDNLSQKTVHPISETSGDKLESKQPSEETLPLITQGFFKKELDEKQTNETQNETQNLDLDNQSPSTWGCLIS